MSRLVVIFISLNFLFAHVNLRISVCLLCGCSLFYVLFLVSRYNFIIARNGWTTWCTLASSVQYTYSSIGCVSSTNIHFNGTALKIRFYKYTRGVNMFIRVRSLMLLVPFSSCNSFFFFISMFAKHDTTTNLRIVIDMFIRGKERQRRKEKCIEISQMILSPNEVNIEWWNQNKIHHTNTHSDLNKRHKQRNCALCMRVLQYANIYCDHVLMCVCIEYVLYVRLHRYS